jgi:hypothetical protein
MQTHPCDVMLAVENIFRMNYNLWELNESKKYLE